MPDVKAVKGDKVSEEPGVTRITLRGTEYTVRELTVDEYEECVAASTDKATGVTTMARLLKMMSLRAISPSLATLSKPLPYPVYRTLEGIVSDTHFVDLVDEAKADEGNEKGPEPAPNE